MLFLNYVLLLILTPDVFVVRHTVSLFRVCYFSFASLLGCCAAASDSGLFLSVCALFFVVCVCVFLFFVIFFLFY